MPEKTLYKPVFILILLVTLLSAASFFATQNDISPKVMPLPKGVPVLAGTVQEVRSSYVLVRDIRDPERSIISKRGTYKVFLENDTLFIKIIPLEQKPGKIITLGPERVSKGEVMSASALKAEQSILVYPKAETRNEYKLGAQTLRAATIVINP